MQDKGLDFKHKEVINIKDGKRLGYVQDVCADLESGKTNMDYYDEYLSSNKDYFVLMVPFGIASNKIYFSNLGPKIPVRIKTIGSILSNVDVKIKEYGINNCLIEMNLVIEIKQQIMLPLISKKIKIINDIPISYKVINGKIPEYYSGSLSKGSNIYSIPIE